MCSYPRRRKRFSGNTSSMHLVSCRHSTSGLIDLINLATRSMRRRTELIFHVVRERRMKAKVRSVQDDARLAAAIKNDFSRRRRKCGLSRWPVSAWRKGAIHAEVDLEHAGIDFPGGVEVIDGNRRVVALRIGHRPLLELAVLGADHQHQPAGT